MSCCFGGERKTAYTPSPASVPATDLKSSSETKPGPVNVSESKLGTPPSSPQNQPDKPAMPDISPAQKRDDSTAVFAPNALPQSPMNALGTSSVSSSAQQGPTPYGKEHRHSVDDPNAESGQLSAGSQASINEILRLNLAEVGLS
jgi:hypothetical protein